MEDYICHVHVMDVILVTFSNIYDSYDEDTKTSSLTKGKNDKIHYKQVFFHVNRLEVFTKK